MTRDSGPTNESTTDGMRIERDATAPIPKTRRGALRTTAVGVGALAGVGGQATGADGDCGTITEADMLAARDAWADPAMVHQAVMDQPDLLAALADDGYLDSDHVAVGVVGRRLRCEAVPEIYVLRRHGDAAQTVSIRPESGSAYATVDLPGDGSGGVGDDHDGDGWDDNPWYETYGREGCHPPCALYGLCCECERQHVEAWEDWDFMACSDYMCEHWVFECVCDCDGEFCFGCLDRTAPIEVEMPENWWPTPNAE